MIQLKWLTVEKIVSTAQAECFAMPVALQPQYDLLERGIEAEVLPLVWKTISRYPRAPPTWQWVADEQAFGDQQAQRCNTSGRGPKPGR